MKLFRKKILVQNDNWKFWEFHDEEEFYGLNFLDATYMDPITQKGFNKEYYLKVIIPENKLAHGKFPSPEANYELQELETKLITRLEKNKINCKQVHRSVYYGAQRMLFEVSKQQEFEKEVNQWKNNLGSYNLEIIEDKAWELYNELQPDVYANQQMGNSEVFDNLVKAGSNLDKNHLIEHAIFGNKLNLKSLETALIKEGGKTITFENDLLEIGFECAPDLGEINEMTYFLIDKSNEHNCTYDGWSTAIMK